MEVYLLGSLLGLGYYLNNTGESKPKDNKYPKRMYRGNMYDYEQYDRVENEIYDLASDKFDKAQNLYQNNVVGQYTPDVLFNPQDKADFSKQRIQQISKENFKDFGNSARSDFCYMDDEGNQFPCNDSSKKMGYTEIKDLCNNKKEIEHFSDPSPIRTDNPFSTAVPVHTGVTSANDDLLENYNLDDQFRQVAEGGKQGVKQIYEKKPFHNNMVPFFGGTMKQSVDPLANETKLNMYTGQWDYSRKQKQEIAPMFVPEKNVKNVYGDNALLSKMDENLSRYVPSLMRTNEAPTEKVYVTPGLNLGYNEVASFGFQDPVRVLPKTTNEIRAKNKPKLTYDRPVISGKAITQDGTLRPNQNKNRPELVVYNEKGEHTFGAKAVVVAEAARPTFLLGRALRSFSTFFMGAAKSTDANKARSNAGYRNDAKRSSYKQTYIAPANADVKRNQLGITDDAKKTKRQTIEKNEHQGYFASAITALTTYFTDPAKKTIKETTLSSTKPMNMKDSRKAGKVYDPTDKARTTVKETTENNIYGGTLNMKTTRKVGTVYDPNDKAKTTVKETTEMNNHEGNLTANKKGKVYDPMDKAKTTIKETTELNNHDGNLKNTRKVGKAYDPTDKAKTTIRETTEMNNHDGNLKNTRKVGKAYDPTDKAKTTIKETTEMNNHEGNLKTSRKVGKAYDPEDKAKTTIKETTEMNNHEGNLKTSRKVGKAYDPEDRAKTTIKETTEINNHEGNLKTSRKVGKAYDPEDKAKATIKETTETNNHEGNITANKKAKVYDPEDKPSATLKDIVKVSNYKGISTVSTKKIKVWDPEDTARYTSRQEALVEDYVGGTNANQTGGAYKVVEADARYTSRQDALVEDYVGTAGHTVGAPQEYDAAYAAETNANKEIIAKGRAPTQNSVKLAAGGDMQNVEVKRLDEDRRNPRDLERDMPNCDVPFQIPPTANPYSITKEKNTVFNNYTERIQPEILDAFRNNPYTQSLHSYVFQ